MASPSIQPSVYFDITFVAAWSVNEELWIGCAVIPRITFAHVGSTTVGGTKTISTEGVTDEKATALYTFETAV